MEKKAQSVSEERKRPEVGGPKTVELQGRSGMIVTLRKTQPIASR